MLKLTLRNLLEGQRRRREPLEAVHAAGVLAQALEPQQHGVLEVARIVDVARALVEHAISCKE